jgi:peroxiredoxin
MKLRQIVAWATLLAAAVVITYTWAPRRGTPLTPPEQRPPATEFTLLDANGAKASLSDYKDKVVLLNFWATWCTPCEVEIPWFKEFERTYKDRGFAVLGVSFDEEGWAAIKPFVKVHEMNYRVLLGTEDMGKMYDEVQALPTTFLIDRQGRVAVQHRGLVSKATYEEGIQKLLAEGGPASPTAQRSSQHWADN